MHLTKENCTNQCICSKCKKPTLFSIDEALSSVEMLSNSEEDGWTYRLIEHGHYAEIAVYDTDGTYLGSF